MTGAVTTDAAMRPPQEETQPRPVPPGRSLADHVRLDGVLRGAALHLFALKSAAALARLHVTGTEAPPPTPDALVADPGLGWRIGPGEGARAERDFIPGEGAGPAADDVRSWALSVLYAAGGRAIRTPEDQEAGLDALPPALRGVIVEALHPDAATRPSAVRLLRALLGHTSATTPAGALIDEATAWRPPARVTPAPPPAPHRPEPLWRRPAFLFSTGTVLVATAITIMLLVQGREPTRPQVFVTITAQANSTPEPEVKEPGPAQTPAQAAVPANVPATAPSTVAPVAPPTQAPVRDGKTCTVGRNVSHPRLGWQETRKCPTYEAGSVFADPSVRLPIGVLWEGRHWFVCQTVGGENPQVQQARNNYWLYTQADEHPSNDGWGWLPATYVNYGDDYEPIPGVPMCPPEIQTL